MTVQLTSQDCSDLEFADSPADFEAEPMPSELRGSLEACVDCLGLRH